MNDPFESARQLFLEGTAHYEAGRFDQAEAALLRSLEFLPGRPSTLMNLAAARIALGRPAEALPDLQAVLAAEPGNTQALCHQGQAFMALNQPAQGLAAFERTLAVDPRFVPALYHRALALGALMRHEEALQAVQPLLAVQDPGAAPAWQLAGQLLQSLQRHDEALLPYRRAVALDPQRGRAWTLVGQLLQQLGQPAEAEIAFGRAIACGDETGLNRYLLAGLRGSEPPAASPPDYVRGLFDPYAEGFDKHLLEELHYSGHAAVVEAAQQAAPGRRWLSVLDLGCGTGLCGSLVRAHAERIEGVDLAPGMIEQARRRNAYDALSTDELVAHLRGTPQRHDLVLAADVFIYIGDLLPVFAGVQRVLLAGGLFVFTVEHLRAPADYQLQPSLRYAHGVAYLRQLAQAHRMRVLIETPVVLREEQGLPIHGMVVCLRARTTRPEAPPQG
jgi:predicted TPR repeat methyltransferase